MKQGLPLRSLLLTVFTSILEVVFLCLAGYILASKGMLGRKTQKQLNRLNVSLFTPALLFSKVAFFLSPEKLRELWIIPIFFVVVTVVSMIVSYLLGSMFRLKKSQRAFAMAASMFMNSNSLPIALMQSLVVTMGNSLRWTEDDNKDTMLGRALTYLVLYSTLGMILRWSYGVRLLSQADDENAIRLPDDGGELDSSPEHDFDGSIHSDANNESGFNSAGTPTIKPNTHAIVVEALPNFPRPQRKQSKFYNSFPNSPNQSRVVLPEIETAANSRMNSDDELTEDESSNHTQQTGVLPVHRPQNHQSASRTWKIFRHMFRRFYRAWAVFNEFMTVPLWAALLSIIVALVQPLQHALDAHMQPVKGALTSAGNCSIPLTLIVLGAYFYPTPEEEGSTSMITPMNGPTGSSSTLVRQRPSRSSTGEGKTVIIAVFSRMIITPLLLFPFIAFSAKFDIQQVFDDPVFVVSTVLLVASPPALTLAQITQAASGDAFERLISRTIFWSYCILTPPTTVFYVVVGLLLSRL
ncbi:auxin efflux carrier [Marasmius fiardii PR-910]|nr:auxin efflux carrier [Marasmius fiardii PR-910]